MSNTSVQARPTNSPVKSEKLDTPYAYRPFGSEKVINLTIQEVIKAIAVPTRSGRQCSSRDAFRFIQMCKAKGLNPYEGDAYLIGYDTKIAGTNEVVAQFSMITAHQALLKRAEVHPKFDGMESGIVVLDENGVPQDRAGDFHMPDDKVVGGWARIKLKDRSVPVYRRLRIERFKRGDYWTGEWKNDAAGMICKCAEGDCLRSAFPNQLGGMYLNSELAFTGAVNIESVVSSVSETNLVAMLPSPSGSESREEIAETESANEATDETPEASAESVKSKSTARAKASPQIQLAQLLLAEKLTFDMFIKYVVENEIIPGADSLDNFDSVPSADAERLLRSPKQLVINVRNANPEPKAQ